MRSGFIWAVGLLFILNGFVSTVAVLGQDVTVDGARQYQTIEGFGTCLIAWSGRLRELYKYRIRASNGNSGMRFPSEIVARGI